MILVVIMFLAVAATGAQLLTHTYLILSGQTSWELSGRQSITYLRPYKPGQMPFNKGIVANFKATFMHQGKCEEFELV